MSYVPVVSRVTHRKGTLMRNLLAPLLAMLLASQAFGCTTKTVVKDQPVGDVPAQEAAEGEDEALPPAAEAEMFGNPLDPRNAGRLAVRDPRQPRGFQGQADHDGGHRSPGLPEARLLGGGPAGRVP